MSDTNAPADFLQITRLNDLPPVTIFMSFGLLNRLSAMVGDISQLPMIYQAPELADAMIYDLLVPRDPQGTPTQVYRQYQFSEGLSTDEAEKLLQWCEGHLYSFFMKRLQTLLKLQNKVIQARTA